MMLDDEAPKKIDINTLPDLKLYWALYTHSLDWQIILHNFVLSNDPKHGKEPLDPKIGLIGFERTTATPIYYLSREHFPVERIARLVGKTPADLEGIETLHLREFKDADGKPAQKDWQAPSVDYWGMA